MVTKDPDRQKFESGDFVSISFEEACARLNKIVQSGIPEPARKNFDAIRKHRNKMVHFFHEAHSGSENPRLRTEIAKEQL